MAALQPVAHNALLLTLAALSAAGARKPKACLRQRRRAIRELTDMPAHPDTRTEAIRGVQRSCGMCPGCKGV